jgi:hypothetical protein
MKKFIKILKKEEVKMKKIILSLILIGILKAFVEVPPGWRHRKLVWGQEVVGHPSEGLWIDSKGDTIVKVFIADTGNLVFFTYSENSGFDWASPVSINPDFLYCLHPRVVIDEGYYILAGFEKRVEPPEYRRIYVYVSADMGQSWRERYSKRSSGSPWLAKKDQTVGLVYETEVSPWVWHIKFTYTQDHGNTWSDEEDLGEGRRPRVVIDAYGNFYVFAYMSGQWKLMRRISQGNWVSYSFPEEINVEEPNRIMRADPFDSCKIHFVYSKNDSVFYRKFENNLWGPRTYIGQGTNADFVVSNNLIHVVIGKHQGNYIYELKHYISQNGGNTWFCHGLLYTSRNFCYEKNKRGRGLGLVDVGENYLGKPYYQGNDDYLVSNLEYATASNSNRHLARIPNTDDLYAVFEMKSDTNDICFTYSLDGGNTWAPYEIIAHGYAPVIYINQNPIYRGTYDISIVFSYFFPPSWERKLMYRAKRIGFSQTGWSKIIHLKMPEGFIPFTEENVEYRPHLYTSAVMIVNPQTNQKYLHVVLRAYKEGYHHLLHVIYEIPEDLSNITQLEPFAWYTISSVPSHHLNFWFPSLAHSSGKRLHVLWQHHYKIYYSETPTDNINWTPPFLISHSDKDAANPSIEVYGDSLYAVWNEDFYGTGKWEIFRKRKRVTENYDRWSDWELVSINSQNYDSRYPTNSELKLTMWNEEDHSNLGEYDPWFVYETLYGPFLNTPEQSYFPHSNRYLTNIATWLYGIWTEKDHLIYRIQSHRKSYLPPGEGSAYLSYSIEENSPYLIQREGIENYGDIKVDFGQTLIYKFELDTIYEYEAEIEFYFEGGNKRKGQVIVSNMNPIIFEYNPGEIKKVKFKIENDFLVDKNLYLTFKNVQGPKISLKSIKIYRYEKEEEIPGGGQGLSLSKIKNSILNLYPVFSKEKFRLEYTLNSFSHVEISIYDILGRKIETILKEKILPPGKYINEFRRPENVKPGIYFIRIETENGNEVKKIIFK